MLAEKDFQKEQLEGIISRSQQQQQQQQQKETESKSTETEEEICNVDKLNELNDKISLLESQLKDQFEKEIIKESQDSNELVFDNEIKINNSYIEVNDKINGTNSNGNELLNFVENIENLKKKLADYENEQNDTREQLKNYNGK